MTYVFSQYWVFAALAALLGLIVGWLTCGRSGEGGLGWLKWGLIAFLVGLVVALLKLVPGWLGHALEVALLLFAAYVIGCWLGCWLHGLLAGEQAPSSGKTAAAAGASAALGAGAAGAERAKARAEAKAREKAEADAKAHAKFEQEEAARARAEAERLAREQAEAEAKARREADLARREEELAKAGLSTAPALDFSVAKGDPLTWIASVGPHAESKLNALGVRKFAQIAAWTPSNGRWIDEKLGAPGRVAAEDWIGQAKRLAAGDMTDHARGVKSGAIAIDDAPPKPAAEAKAAAAAFAAAGAAQGAEERVDEAQAADRDAVEVGEIKPVEVKPASVLVTPKPRPEPGHGGIAPAPRAGLALARASSSSATAPSAPLAPSLDEAGRPAGDSSGLPEDDLTWIRGVGPVNAGALHGLGVRRFAQIADWSPENARWVGAHLKFPGRIERERWIEQCRLLAAGLETDHARAAKAGEIDLANADAPLDEAEAERFAAALPQAAAPVEGEVDHAGARPLGLLAPSGGKADNLTLIRGIGRQNEERLHGLGIWHFSQIAGWSAENARWVGSYLAFPGRIDREGWIAQAQALASGQLTEFAARVKKGDVPTSRE